MVALFSFDPADPGWSQTGYQVESRNLAGAVGAYISDLLLNLFGWIAYSLPFILAFTGWLLFQKYRRLIQLDYLTLGLKFIGFILLYIGITSIASMNFDDIFYFSAGGILGDVFSNSLLPYLSFVGCTLLFVTFCCSGFVLLTGISLLKVTDTIGEYTIFALEYLITLPALLKHQLGTGIEKSEQNSHRNNENDSVEHELPNDLTAKENADDDINSDSDNCLLYTSPSPRD